MRQIVITLRREGSRSVIDYYLGRSKEMGWDRMGRDAHHTVSVGKYFRQVLMVLSLSRATCDPINQAMPCHASNRRA